MKQVLIDIGLFYLALLIVLGIEACTSTAKEENKAIIYVVLDFTDNSAGIVPFDAHDILKKSGVQENKEMSAEVVITTISDITFQKRHTAYLPAGNGMMENPHVRAQTIKDFEMEVDSLLQMVINEAQKEQLQTQCYHSVCVLLHDLIEESGTTQHLFIMGNMVEHNDYFSFIGEKSQDIKERKEEYRVVLDELCELPRDLRGIHIAMIWDAQSVQDNTNFIACSGFFSDWFIELGAEVTVGADIH